MYSIMLATAFFDVIGAHCYVVQYRQIDWEQYIDGNCKNIIDRL